MSDFLAFLKEFLTPLLSALAIVFSFNAPPLAAPALPPAQATQVAAPATFNATTTPEAAQPKATNTPAKKPESKKKVAPKIETPEAKPLEESAPADTPANATGTSTGVTPYPSTVSDKRIKDSLVNIFCALDMGDAILYTSGTGAFIDPKGVIITNAHVAQHFLLSEYLKSGKEKCVIRSGNPARKHYTADILYLPPAWIKENYRGITGEEPQGTGEDDYAFLIITGTTDGSALPSSFPSLPYSASANLNEGDTIVAAGYPAEFIPEESVNTKLYGVSLPAKIREIYTFTADTIDLIRMNGGYLAQRGSSGGPVVNSRGSLIGIIATASMEFFDGERHLNAITLNHVSRSLGSQGRDLKDLLTGDPRAEAANYAQDTAPELEMLLKSVIEK